MSEDREFLFIDLPAIAHPIYHMAQSNPDPNATAMQIVDRVRALASEHPHCAICCEGGRSFRKDIDPGYKANRPESDAVLQHQIVRACEVLASDGFPVWSLQGYEADDLIATAVAMVLAIPGARALIVTGDKDLTPLTADPRVQLKSLKDGSRIDALAVEQKFGVPPLLMPDFLCLVGDTSDNIPGAKGIGRVKAADILRTFGPIKEFFAARDAGEVNLPASTLRAMDDFRERWPVVHELVALRYDADIPFAEVLTERGAGDVDPLITEEEENTMLDNAMDESDAPEEPAAPLPPTPAQAAGFTVGPSPVTTTAPAPLSMSLVPAVPVEWAKQLEPVNLPEVYKLSGVLLQSRLLSGYGTAAAVVSTVLAGRELGLSVMASLRAFHIIESKHTLAADAGRALVLRSGMAKYFRCIERTAERCTWETWRVGDPEPMRLTYTMEQGKLAWQKDERAWKASSWGRNPEDMLSARASSKLARLVYSDILFGLYAPEEIRDEVTA